MVDKVRHPVAQGGLWSTPKASYSKETQNLLKEMMKESKLTNFQQRQLDKTMKDGRTLPLKCHPTSSAKSRKPVNPGPRQESLIVDPRENPLQIRTKGQIEASGAYDRDQFRPKPPTFYEKDKQRLANIMAYGEDVPPPDMKKIMRKMEEIDDEVTVDRFQELQAEIAERREFLNEMESLGRGKEYRTVIETEISQKIREMEVIDRKKSKELEALIAADKKKREAAESGGIPHATGNS